VIRTKWNEGSPSRKLLPWCGNKGSVVSSLPLLRVSTLVIKMRYCYYHWFRVEKIAVVEVEPPTRDAFSRNLEKPLRPVADGSPMSQLMNLSNPARSSVNSSAILLAERSYQESSSSLDVNYFDIEDIVETFGGGRKTIDTATLTDSPTTKTSANFLDEISRCFTNGSVLK
ncbi:hypothetical protein V1478_007169, partial [Vespula squamosa]